MIAENERTWKQRYLYRMFSHHTQDKEMENYVVNAIWARLDDLNVKPVTQQYVRRPNGYALIDLYFPADQLRCRVRWSVSQETIRSGRRTQNRPANSAVRLQRRRDWRSAVWMQRWKQMRFTARIREIVCEIRQRSQKRRTALSMAFEQEEEWRSNQRARYSADRGCLFLKKQLPTFAKNASARMRTIASSAAFSMWPMIGCFGVLSWRLNCLTAQKVAQSRGWVNELSADWNVIIEHNNSGATPVKTPG